MGLKDQLDGHPSTLGTAPGGSGRDRPGSTVDGRAQARSGRSGREPAGGLSG
jgi:hypothetical protein